MIKTNKTAIKSFYIYHGYTSYMYSTLDNTTSKRIYGCLKEQSSFKALFKARQLASDRNGDINKLVLIKL